MTSSNTQTFQTRLKRHPWLIAQFLYDISRNHPHEREQRIAEQLREFARVDHHKNQHVQSVSRAIR